MGSLSWDARVYPQPVHHSLAVRMHSTTPIAFLSHSHHHSFCSLLWYETIPVIHKAKIENRICLRWGAALYWNFWSNQEEINLGTRSLATVLTAQGESGLHPRLGCTADLWSLSLQLLWWPCRPVPHWNTGHKKKHPPSSVLKKGETR